MNISWWFDFGTVFFELVTTEGWISYLTSIIFVFLSICFLNFPEPQIEQTWLKKQTNNFWTVFFKSVHSVQLSRGLTEKLRVLRRILKLSVFLSFLCRRERTVGRRQKILRKDPRKFVKSHGELEFLASRSKIISKTVWT